MPQPESSRGFPAPRLPAPTLLALVAGFALAAGLAFGRGLVAPGALALLSAAGFAWGLVRSALGPYRAAVEAAGRAGFEAPAHSLAQAFESSRRELGSSREAEKHLDEVIDTMAGALILADPERRILRVNKAARTLTGHDEAELLGQPIDVVFPERDPINTGSLVQLSTSSRVRNVERVFRHRDGVEIPVLFSGSALQGPDGSLLQYVCVAYDIRRNKEYEARLQASIGEKELLLREVHHRVKNNLQVISSLLDLQSEHLDDPRDLELIRDSRHRIRSMALIHEQLYRHEDLTDLELGPYLENIAGHLFRSYGVEPGRLVLRCRLEEIAVDLDRAVSCGLIANELVSNCLEHAFPEGSGGEIHIVARRRPDGWAELSVSDDGRGFDPEAPRSRSMGLELVDMMARQLRGRFEMASSPGARGSRCVVEFPLEDDESFHPPGAADRATDLASDLDAGLDIRTAPASTPVWGEP